MIDGIEKIIKELKHLEDYSNWRKYSNEIIKQIKKIVEELEYLIFLLKQGGIK